MNIYIYKPGKPILFNEQNDTASFSRENINLINYLLQKKNNVSIISETDNVLLKKEINNNIYCDILLISNGLLAENEEDKIHLIKSKYKILLSTDLALTKLFKYNYDYILTQTKFDLNTVENYPRGKYYYGHLEKLFILNRKITTKIFKDFNNKKNILYFAGDERDRTDDMKEYIWRDNVIWNGKSHTLNIRNKISIQEVEQNYKKYKYTIVIADKEYNKYNFVTQRFYESAINGVIPFMDIKVDNDELILPKKHYLRVANYNELCYKMNELNNNKILQEQIINNIIQILYNQKNQLINFLNNFFYNL